MRYVTFNQALLAVGLIGFTLVLMKAWEFALWASIIDSVEGSPSTTAPLVMLLVALCVSLLAVAVAAMRMRGGGARHPLTPHQLLAVIAVFALVVAAALSTQLLSMIALSEWMLGDYSPQRTQEAESYVYRSSALGQSLPSHLSLFAIAPGDYFTEFPSYRVALTMQVVALALPLGLLGYSLWRLGRSRVGAATPPDAVPPLDVATFAAVLALFIGCAVAPTIIYKIAVSETLLEDIHGISTASELIPLVIAVVVPLLVLLARLAARVKAATQSGWSLVLIALLALTAAGVGPGATNPSLLVALLAIVLLPLVLEALNRWDPPAGSGDDASAGRLLAATAVAGLAVVVAATPTIIQVVATWRFVADHWLTDFPHGWLVVVPAAAYIIHAVILAVAIRRLGAGGPTAAPRSGNGEEA